MSSWYILSLSPFHCSILIAILSTSLFYNYYRIQEITIPVEINPTDGVVSTLINVQINEFSTPTTLRIGLDTGISLSWFLDTTCQVHTSIVNSQLRRKLLVKSVETRHTTVVQVAIPLPLNDTFKKLNIKYADGTLVQGVFVPNVSWHFKKSNQPIPTKHFLSWGAATSISETVQYEKDDSRFEQSNVDGWLGLGISTSNYPNSYAFIASNTKSSKSWSITFQLQRFPYSVVFRTLGFITSTTNDIQIQTNDAHWSLDVTKVIINGCDATENKYKVLLDVGAGSIFTPTNIVPKSCWDNANKKEDYDNNDAKSKTFNMTFVLENGKTVSVSHLQKNISYHQTLRIGNQKPLTIVLGLPFFMRQKVTLTRRLEQNALLYYANL